MEIDMNKKIEALKTAYVSKDRAKLIKAAAALVAYNNKHPMAVVSNPCADEIVRSSCERPQDASKH